MKPIFRFLFVCLLFLAIESSPAQIAADYYLPLRVGNYLKFHTQGNLTGWDARTSRHSIDGSNSISGQIYFREQGMEIPDNNPSNINIFHVFWLRKDSGGDLLIGAMSISSSNVDSATLFNPPGGYFTHQFLVPGYKREYLWAGQYGQDSTMSNNETVQVPAGTFTNCIKSREIHRDSLGNITFLEYHYYAHGIGMVLNVREIPVNHAHTDELIQYNTVTSIDEKSRTMGPTGFALEQNYPNPFNPSTVIRFSIPTARFVSLTVHNVLGLQVAVLMNQVKFTGTYTATLDGTGLPSGVYFYTLRVGSFTETKRLVLLK